MGEEEVMEEHLSDHGWARGAGCTGLSCVSISVFGASGASLLGAIAEPGRGRIKFPRV